MAHNGYYLDLNDSNFNVNINENQQLILVKFDANWSGPCHIIEPIIEELAYEYNSQVAFFKINVDENTSIKKAYGISKVPTLLFFKDGEILDHVEGAVPKRIITDKLTELLEKSNRS